jgi:hypothetical protein
VGIGLLALVGGIACDNQQQGGGNTGAAGIEKFRQNGPERAANANSVAVGTCTRFLPNNVGPADSRPGLGWANGTGASPATYNGILSRVASFGTLVAAANTAQSGTGNETSRCIDEIDRDRVDSNGSFATSGHSQGGSGSINASRINAKVRVSCPVELDGTFTATSNGADLDGTANGPAVIMCGTADTLAPCNRTNNGDGKFNQSRVPVIILSVVGAPHVGANSPTGNGGLFSALVTTCVEAALGGDAQASAALRPGGVANSGALNNIRRRNF